MRRPTDQTKSTIDRIGERLKAGDFSPSILQGLDSFRSSHDRIIPLALRAVTDWGPHTLTLRAAKSTASIVAKLRRESVRLSQIQDIAGCRIIIPGGTAGQELMIDGGPVSLDAVLAFRNPDIPLGYRIVPPAGDDFFRKFLGSSYEPILFGPDFDPVADGIDHSMKIINRLDKPQFGYRAVHFVIGFRSRFMEIQVRTQLQHAWAELSEKAADKYGHELKYGKGDSATLDKLLKLSSEIAAFEEYEFRNRDNERELDIMRQEILDVIRSEALRI